jgi:hypothetical protein
MFFKKTEPTKNRDFPQKPPRAPRYPCKAYVRINGFDGAAVLRNINQGGFCMESRTYAAIKVGEHHAMQIKPEASANINPLDLEVEVRWVKSTEFSFSTGFLILTCPSGELFEKYLNHIKARN